MNTLTKAQRLLLVGKPVLFAVFVTFLYLMARPSLNPLIAEDEGAMTSGAIAFLGTLYAIVGGFSVFEVLKQWNAVWEAYVTHNKARYDENIGKRLPWHLKAAWFATSVLLVVAFILTYWHNTLTATFVVFSVTFCVSFWWLVAIDLDDYFTGYWNIPKVSDTWWG